MLKVSFTVLLSAIATVYATNAGAFRQEELAPTIPGLQDNRPLSDAEVGAVLLEELRCTACHLDRNDNLAVVPGPNLSDIAARVAPDYLASFLAQPHTVQPGSKMPAMFHGETPAQRAKVAEALTHFLLSQSTEELIQTQVETDQINRGRKLFHQVGCVACHPPKAATANGGSVPDSLSGSIDLNHVASKYSIDSLARFLFQPMMVRPAGRMPDMGLSRSESQAIASFLIGEGNLSFSSWKPRRELVRQGQEFFQLYGCYACHQDISSSAGRSVPPLNDLNPNHGCLTPVGERRKSVKTLPHYVLSRSQRKSIRLALNDLDVPWSAQRKLNHTLTGYNCFGCHQRNDNGGVHPALNPYFKTSEHELGNEARIPPQLTDAGSKLQKEWMQKVLFDGARVRPYMHVRMPQFGEANLKHLPDLFDRVDANQKAVTPFPTPKGEAARTAREAGRELVGSSNASCISCHNFNGKPASPGFRGIDLITTTERLKPDWFKSYLINPQEFRPGTVMPTFWLDGESAQKEILQGDTDEQIEAIWFYLSEGRTARAPKGVNPVRSRLEVAESTRTYRGRSRIAGFRGIAVGFPGGVNCAFNANTGTLSGIWKGDFITVRWDGQGAGDFQPAARPISLAQDVSFYSLGHENEPWPLRPYMDEENPVNPDPMYPRNRGYQFLGYQLDRDGIPTFSYRSDSVTIEDRMVADFSGPNSSLQRNLTFQAPEEKTIQFRVLTGNFETTTEGAFQMHKLRLVIPNVQFTVRALEHQEQELILTLPLPEGASNLILNYEILP